MDLHLSTINDEVKPYAILDIKLDGFLYRDLQFNDCKFSVKSPNNYCFIEKNVFLIEEITEKSLDINIKGKFVVINKSTPIFSQTFFIQQFKHFLFP